MKSPKAPKEDPKDKAARERERRLAERERARAVKDNAEDLTTDLTAVYGAPKGLPAMPAPTRAFSFPSLFKMFGA